MMALKVPAPSSGCIVLLESGSGWPKRAFESSADCDRVVVAHLDHSEHASQVLHRIRSHCAEFERCGAKVHCIILACSGVDHNFLAHRAELVRSLIPLLDRTDGKIVLESDPSAGLTTQDLMATVGSVLVDLNGRSLSFVGNEAEVASAVRVRQRSGYSDEGNIDCSEEDQYALAEGAYD